MVDNRLTKHIYLLCESRKMEEPVKTKTYYDGIDWGLSKGGVKSRCLYEEIIEWGKSKTSLKGFYLVALGTLYVPNLVRNVMWKYICIITNV